MFVSRNAICFAQHKHHSKTHRIQVEFLDPNCSNCHSELLSSVVHLSFRVLITKIRYSKHVIARGRRLRCQVTIVVEYLEDHPEFIAMSL